ncbi:MAG: hypothetical protein HRT44_04035 [Bdellovibrionales bacterium]|nr:hypothetical protein [Bdellovibrionales bacterium]NQZ18412.1 hypothetical protein [Bdellovibrionales bacterium]
MSHFNTLLKVVLFVCTTLMIAPSAFAISTLERCINERLDQISPNMSRMQNRFNPNTFAGRKAIESHRLCIRQLRLSESEQNNPLIQFTSHEEPEFTEAEESSTIDI